MTEIPEHLLKRAQAAREKAAAKAPEEGASNEAAPAAPAAAADAGGGDAGKIPAHLLERSRAAKARKEGGGEAAPAPAPVAAAVGTGVAAPAGPPLAAGPGGHTQRLLTVVKSGSIQDVKAKPVDKVHTWPHLLIVEFVAALACTVLATMFSIWVNAPLLSLADPNQTPNPSKAPWYFLGLQELLRLFHPMVAGVTIPGIGLFLLILAPYIDRNPNNAPEKRKFAVSLMTVHLMFWATLVMIGSFFRGPGQNFVLPWIDGIFFDL